jgi:Gametolysin peptidase M11
VRGVARVVGGLGAVLASLAFVVPGSTAAAVAKSVGKDRVLAVLVSYGAQPYPRSAVFAAMTEAGAFFERSSFGKLSIVPRVTPWLDGGAIRPDCGGSDQSFAPLRAVAAAAGYDTTTFDSVIYVVDGVRCGFHGIEHGTDVMLVTEPDARLIVHELGHTFGLGHAAAVAVCNAWCITDEQGDLFSPMGSGFVDFNAYEKEQLGWIPRQPRVTHPGAYTVFPRTGRSLAHQALVLEMPDAEYWLEQRPDTKTPALIVHVVRPDEPSSWPIPTSTLLLAPIRPGHVTIAPGQTFRVHGEFAVKVARKLGAPMRLLLTLSARTR